MAQPTTTTSAQPTTRSDADDAVARPLGLIGGIGLTEVHVYAQHRAPDGSFSGCPHVHALTDEGYFVLAGTGRVDFHDMTHGLRTLELRPGHYVHFPPLAMHRLVSDGELVILGMMGNAGLAERGEARIYFGPAVDADPVRFAELMSLPKRDGLNGALARRDAAVSAYMELMRLWQDDRPGYFRELRRFVAVHCAAAAGKRDEFATQIDGGPLAWGRVTSQRLAELPDLPTVPPDVYLSAREGGESALGMCGVLRPILTLARLPHDNPEPAILK